MHNMISIHPAKNEDGQEIKNLMIEILKSEGIYSEEYHKKYPDLDLDEPEKAYKNGCFFIAKADRKIVGTIGVFGIDKSFAQIRRFYVHPDFRGRVIGKSLLEKVFELCKKNRFAAVITVTETQLKRASKVYVSSGFEVFKSNSVVNYLVKFFHPMDKKLLNERKWIFDFDGESWKLRTK